MYKAIEILMQEHRVIERVLGSLEAFAGRLDRGETASRETVRDFADFFSKFADRCHHGKEEERLFLRMVDHGFPKEAGPIGVMLAEHVSGREHVGALARIGRGTGPLGDGEREEVREHALAYVPLLRAHIQKEDGILYPMATEALPATVLEELAAEFEAFESQVTGPGAHEGLHALADRLAGDFPPEPGGTSSGTCGAGRIGHP